MIHSICLLRVRIVLFRDKHKVWRKVRVSKYGSNARDDVSIEDFADLASNHDLVANKTWTTGQLLIDFRIELIRRVKRQSKAFRDLNDAVQSRLRSLIAYEATRLWNL